MPTPTLELSVDASRPNLDVCVNAPRLLIIIKIKIITTQIIIFLILILLIIVKIKIKIILFVILILLIIIKIIITQIILFVILILFGVYPAQWSRPSARWRSGLPHASAGSPMHHVALDLPRVRVGQPKRQMFLRGQCQHQVPAPHSLQPHQNLY